MGCALRTASRACVCEIDVGNVTYVMQEYELMSNRGRPDARVGRPDSVASQDGNAVSQAEETGSQGVAAKEMLKRG